MQYIIDAVMVIEAPNEQAAREVTDLMLRTKPYIKEYTIVHVEIKDAKP